MILHYGGLSAINKHKISLILHYEGLSAINNIKYHDITLWRAISNKQHKIS